MELQSKNCAPTFSRRRLLKGLVASPFAFRAAPFFGSSFAIAPAGRIGNRPAFPFADTRLMPHYPEKSPLANILDLVAPGSDEYITERYAYEIDLILQQWSQSLKEKAVDFAKIRESVDPSIQTTSSLAGNQTSARS